MHKKTTNSTILVVVVKWRHRAIVPLRNSAGDEKTCQTHLASITSVYKYLLSKQWFYNVSRPFHQIKSANRHKRNIFLIKSLSMLASPQTKMVKPPDKSHAFLTGRLFCVGVALNFNSFGRNCVTTFPWLGYFKSMLLRWFIRKITKISRVFAQDVPTGVKACVLYKRRLVNVGNLN